MKKKTAMIILAAALSTAAGACGHEETGRGAGAGERTFPLIDCTSSMECQDGIWCNGIEYCGCFGGVCGRCLPGFEQNCDDNNSCTVDNCVNDVLGTPGSTGVDGEFGTGHCSHLEICQRCIDDGDCEDYKLCTDQSCVGNVCRFEATDCDDSDFCTQDSCDELAGCVHDPIPNCCHEDAECGDGSACSIDSCNQLTHACVHTADTGAACDYPNDCYDPGRCRSDGLCGPGTLNAPSNDTCNVATPIVLDASGQASVSGSTLCATDNHNSSRCGGGGSPEVLYRFTYQVGADYQLYSYNVVMDADYNSVLYAQSACGNAYTEITCNDNCTSDVMILCSDYSLGLLDSAINIPPSAVGSTKNVFLVADGSAGSRGNFQLRLQRVPHKNNPCHTTADTGRRVDATFGGEYRGNIDGYINDLQDSSHSWLKSPCHDAAAAAGGDWPANAWYTVSPIFETTYCVWTDEVTPPGWFDTVISVWDNTLPSRSGCGGLKRYMTCTHLAGQNGIMSPTKVQVTVPGGSTYMVGISSYARPTSGDYLLHVDIGTCGQTCEDQGGRLYNNHCYTQLTPLRLFPDSEVACYAWGGHLAVINDAAENEFVRANFAAVTTDSPYIGFMDRNVEGVWEWVTGDAVTYTNWDAGQPDNFNNQDWAGMRSSGAWADYGSANSPRSCICEKP